MVRPPSVPNPWIRRGILLLVVLGIPLLWKCFLLEAPGLLHRGEGAAPGCFRFHALGLVKADVAYPRPLEGTLPAPAAGSSPAAQLQLMGWWDGRAWTPKALSQGRVEGRSLKVRLGSLALVDVVDVSPARDYNGPTLCQADYRVRWDLPESDRELFKVRALVGLRPPMGLGLQTPGQELVKQVTLERSGLGWKVQDAPQVKAQESGAGGSAWAWLRWLL